MRIIQEELAASNLKQTTYGEGKDKRNSSKSKKCTVLRFESQSRQATRILRPWFIVFTTYNYCQHQ